MNSFEGFQRAMQIGDSPNHGLNFCVGTWSEMGPAIVPQAIRHFAAQGKIFYVHFRDVMGTAPKFREAFVDEGNLVAIRDRGMFMDPRSKQDWWH